MNQSIGIGLLVVVAVLTGIGHINFKLVAVRDIGLREKLTAPRFLTGMACFLLGPVLAIVAARYVSFSLLYAMTALNFVFILLFSKWRLGEPIDGRKLSGVAAIIVGLVLVAFARS
jgi:drug/metabolite transporter (DMT)-like permease